MIRCQRRQNSNSQQARKFKNKFQVIFPFCKSFKELLSIVPYCFWMATMKLFHVIEQFFWPSIFQIFWPTVKKMKKKHSGIPFSYLRKRRQSLLFDFPNNFIFMKLEAFFNIEFWNSNSNQNQIGWSGRVQWQIIFHLLSLCIQGDSALMLVIWK